MISNAFVLFAVLIRIVSVPLGNVFQKQLTGTNHPLWVNFFTYLILSVAALAILPVMMYTALLHGFWFYAALGGLFGAVGNGFIVKALEKGDLSVLGPINAYKSVVGMITGFFLLGELPGFLGLCGVILIILGSYFVLDTTEERFTWKLFRRKEIRYRLWAMIFTAVEAVFIKKVILASSPLISFACWCWFGCFFSFFLLLIYKVRLKGQIISIRGKVVNKYFFLIMCLGCMQLSTNYVLDHMPVGYALSLFQLSTVVSVLFGYKIFHEKGLWKKLIGSAIMVSGSFFILNG